MFRLRLLFVAAALLVLSACQAEVDIGLEVAPDGSGTVTVELAADAAVDEAVGNLGGQLRAGDLERAGWDIATAVADDGSTFISATKAVGGSDGWQAVLDEIAGPGVFNDVQVTTGDEFAKANQQLSFEVDLRDGWELFSDDEVAAVLGGEPFGSPIETLTGGRDIDDIVAVGVTVIVASDDDGAPTTRSFTPRFDQDQPLPIVVESTTENSTAVLLRWIAMALFILFVLATALAITGIVLQRRSDRLRPNPRPASLASRVPGATAPKTAVSSTAAAAGNTETVRLVVIEPLSVLYGQSRTVDEYLLPFVRDHQGTARADTIVEGYRSLIAGSSDTAAFWELCGTAGSANKLDEHYVDRRTLRPGAADFLAEMQNRRIPVAATTNDAAAWSEFARDRDRLSAVWPWLISSVVGTTTANGAMFEVLRRESGVAHGHCLYVDTDLASLDAAKELGMKTALFDSGDLELPEIIGHPVVTDFKGLFGSKR